jgi:hypothetical protein
MVVSSTVEAVVFCLLVTGEAATLAAPKAMARAAAAEVRILKEVLVIGCV